MNDPRQVFTIASVLGGLGIWLLLPRGSLGGRMTGAALASVALGLFGSQLPGLDSYSADAVFWVLAAVTVVAAAGAVTFRSPVYCAIWFGLSLVGTAGLFLFSGAQFLSVATIAVYAGAILVTFLFVLMLAQPEGRAYYDRVSWEPLVSAAVGAAMIGILSMTITSALRSSGTPNATPSPAALNEGVLYSQHAARLGSELFGKYLITVEIVGTLLLAALVGAAVIVAQGKERGDRR